MTQIDAVQRVAENERIPSLDVLRGERQRLEPLTSSLASGLAATVRSATRTIDRTATRDAVAQLREALAPDDQALLVLRLERGLAWEELARVFETAAETPEALGRAYRAHALAHPHLYRLMTESPLPRERLTPGVEDRAAAEGEDPGVLEQRPGERGRLELAEGVLPVGGEDLRDAPPVGLDDQVDGAG